MVFLAEMFSGKVAPFGAGYLKLVIQAFVFILPFRSINMVVMLYLVFGIGQAISYYTTNECNKVHHTT
jgi:hypothetical protein